MARCSVCNRIMDKSEEYVNQDTGYNNNICFSCNPPPRAYDDPENFWSNDDYDDFSDYGAMNDYE